MITLRNQILLLLFVTVVLITASIVGATWINTSEYTGKQVSETIDVGHATFGQLLRSREMQLVNSAELLTSDFGFKQAVATRDSATIESVLYNHGGRIQADLMFMTSLRGKTIASTHSSMNADQPFPHMPLIKAAAKQGGALSFLRIGDALYQVAVVSVRAPLPIGFAGVGFKLNQTVADELRALAKIDVTFRVSGEGAEQVISTLSATDVVKALESPDNLSRNFLLPFGATQLFVTKAVELNSIEGVLGTAYLSVPLDSYLAEYAKLRNEILLISLLTLLFTSLAGIVYTRSITFPLDRVVRMAQQLSKGHFEFEKVFSGGAKEVKTLHTAVNQMGRDIREREQRLQFQAEHDKLTRVLNRSTLVERLSEDIESDQTARLICCVNIKGFRAINDSFGPQIGDRCLEMVSSRLWENTAVSELVGRYGGDEFIVVTRMTEDVSSLDVIERLMAIVRRPYKMGELELNLTFTTGFSEYPAHGEDASQLIRRATIAIDRGRHENAEHRGYLDGEDEEYGHRLKLIRDLDHALQIDDGQLFMNYQPKLNLGTGKVDKVEALIRWVHPEDGFLSPEMFVALAEQSGLIGKLTDWVVGKVIQERAAWQPGQPHLQVAINVSAQDLERDDLLQATLKALRTYRLPVSVLCFEMTERDMMNDADKAFGLMLKYRAAGFDLSVDDYGIGQSSLSKLKQMPVNEIKIDRLFITHIETTPDDQTIVNSTIKLGHDFGLRVIAEGVESLAATELLAGMGCDYIQGYFLAKPMKGDDLLNWMSSFDERKHKEFKTVFVT